MPMLKVKDSCQQFSTFLSKGGLSDLKTLKGHLIEPNYYSFQYFKSLMTWEHGRHAMISFVRSLPIPILCHLDIEACRFYNRNHQMDDIALLTTQYALRPLIDSEIKYKSHFIKIFLSEIKALTL